MDVGQSQHLDELYNYNGYEYCSPSPSPSGLHHSRLMSLPLPLLLPLLRPNPLPSVGEGATRQDQVEENNVTLLPGLPTTAHCHAGGWLASWLTAPSQTSLTADAYLMSANPLGLGWCSAHA